MNLCESLRCKTLVCIWLLHAYTRIIFAKCCKKRTKNPDNDFYLDKNECQLSGAWFLLWGDLVSGSLNGLPGAGR